MDKWQEYEQEKKNISTNAPEKYDEKIKEIVDRIKV